MLAYPGLPALLLGAAGLALWAFVLWRTLRTGTATLRGGRRISIERQPALYWLYVAAIGVSAIVPLIVLYFGFVAWLRW
jgi:hypothetical protein